MKEYSAYQQTESYKQFMKLKYAGMTIKINITICLIHVVVFETRIDS